MLAPVPRGVFEEKNRAVIDDSPALSQEDLAFWSRGRDWLRERAVADAAAEAQRNGTPPRRHPRARVALQAYVGGHGPAFTEDVGFGGVALYPHRGASLQPGESATVRLKVANRSIYVEGNVAWATRARVGVEFTAIHPADERVLQAVVCERLLQHW